MKKYIALILTLSLPVVLHAAPAGVIEPATTFYGKVIGTADLQPFLITEGRLNWIIRCADGTDVTLTVKLFAFNKGTFSYRLDVPHSAFSLGLAAQGGGVPLALYEQTHRHLAVTLDGVPVTLLGPAGDVFTSAQILRSSTYRLDLGVDRHAPDTDGDGVPDWWCDMYGLDKQGNIANNLLPGGGGLTVAQAYALGLDPGADHTVPAVLTEETIVYAGGHTALILEAFDLDTPLTNLTYTVTTLPFGGDLTLLTDTGTLTPLDLGATFTQDDVLAARVIYRHEGDVADPGLFEFTLTDGDHEPVANSVRLLLYEPAISEVSLRSSLYQLASAGFVVAEGGDVDASEAPVAYALAGIALTGGGMDDVLLQNDTGSCIWTGGAGADRFVVSDFTVGTVVITDFSVAEGDMLDITALAPTSGMLSDNVTLAGDTLTFATGLTVVLEGLTGTDLYTLVSGGGVLTDLTLPSRVSIVATASSALRNGPVAGSVTIYREGGSTAGTLTVNLSIAGSAVNGVDYQSISTVVAIPAGEASVTVLVTPYTAGGSQAVVAVLNVLSGSGYVLSPLQSANVTIDPRKIEVGVEALLPVAVREGAESGYFLLWRDAVGSSLAVQNTLGGGAVRGTDFQTYNIDTGVAMNPAMVNFGASENEKLIEVAVLPTANFSAGSKRVTLAPVASTRYSIAQNMASAEVALIDRWESFEDWLMQGQGGGGIMGFSAPPAQDPSTLLKRYAYGSDSQGSDVSGFPRPFLLSDGMTVRVKQPLGRRDVQYNLRGFTDLADPVGSNVGFTPVSAPQGQPDSPDWKYYRLNSNGARGFISVDVQ